MSVSNYQLRDAAHQSPAYATPTPAAQDDEACSLLFGNPHDLVGPVAFGYPQVPLSDFPSGPLDLLCLLFEHFLRLLAEVFGHFGGANPVGRIGGIVRRIAGDDGHDVQLGVEGFGQIDGGGGCQLGVPRAVGGQKDLGGEDAHIRCPPRSTLAPRLHDASRTYPGRTSEKRILGSSRTLSSKPISA